MAIQNTRDLTPESCLRQVETLLNSGQTGEAISVLDACLELHPLKYPLWEWSAVIHSQCGDLEKVVECCRRMVALEPKSATARFNLSFALHGASNLEEAITHYREAIKLDPADPEFHYNLGLALSQAGYPKDAAVSYRQALLYRPDFIPAINNLAYALKERGESSEAIRLLLEAIQSHPSELRLRLALGDCYDDGCQFAKAVETYRDAAHLAPGDPVPYVRMAGAFRRAGQLEEALSYSRKALELDPQSVDARLGIVDACETKGDNDRALQELQPLLEKEKNNEHVLLRYAVLARRLGKYQQPISLLRKAVDKPVLMPDIKRKLHFVLGDLYDAIGEYDLAFEQFSKGNQLKGYLFDKQRYKNLIDSMITIYSRELVQGLPHAPVHDDRPGPIFIIGMPRSGTSLIEQILSCHPDVQGVGELDFIPRMIVGLSGGMSSRLPYPYCVPQLTESRVGALASEYFAKLKPLLSGLKTRYMTDKMPENFLHLGMIQLLFPNARIIHCVRNPLDTCLSCYFQEFSGSHHYAYDLSNLGAYYREYEKLMTHWRNVLDLEIIEVQYERVVQDFEGGCRQLFAALDLDWDDGCLSFHNSGRVVGTASYDQVRRPIYSTSAGRWRNYDAHLSVLKAELAYNS